jgi:hypothetical protein
LIKDTTFIVFKLENPLQPSYKIENETTAATLIFSQKGFKVEKSLEPGNGAVFSWVNPEISSLVLSCQLSHG